MAVLSSLQDDDLSIVYLHFKYQTWFNTFDFDVLLKYMQRQGS